jgi:CBS domain-containing protein
MVLRAREIMTDRVVAVRPETPLAQARTLLGENRFSALPVVDQYRRLIGIVSAADVLAASAGTPGEQRHPLTVGAVMSTDVMRMSPDADVGIIAHRLRTYGELRVMPIVDHGILVGIVTRGDLLRPRVRGGKVGRWLRRMSGHVQSADESQEPPTDPARVRTHGRGSRVVERGDAPAVATAALARDVMTSTGLVTVTETTSTERAAELLVHNRFTALPVVDDIGRLVGIVSEADLIYDPLSGRRAASGRTVDAVMTTEVATVPPDTSVPDVVRMLSGGLRLLPVVEAGRLVGLISRSDLLRVDVGGSRNARTTGSPRVRR